MAHVGSWEWDLQTDALRWSDEHYRIFGLEPGTAVDFARSFAVVHPGDRPLVAEAIAAAREERRKYDLELRIVRSDGSRRWIWTRGEFVRNEAGQPIRMVGTVQDITDRKDVQQALQRSEQSLRALMEEREQLSRDLHDTILQTIYAIGFNLEECQRLIVRDQGQAAVVQLSATIANLNDMIRDIRKFIAGQQQSTPSGRQLGARLKAVAQEMKTAHRVRFRIHIDPLAASWLSPDETRHMMGIAREAMSNAMRHSHAKMGVLSLVATGVGVRFELSDNGIGMNLSAVRDCGQGMANLASRARSIGARLEIISTPGGGTRIIVDLPRKASVSRAGMGEPT